MPTKISLLPFKLQGATEYSILTLTPLPKKILPVTINTININRYIFLQKWQNHFLYFTFWGVNVLLLTLSWKTLLKFFFLKKILYYLSLHLSAAGLQVLHVLSFIMDMWTAVVFLSTIKLLIHCYWLLINATCYKIHNRSMLF